MIVKSGPETPYSHICRYTVAAVFNARKGENVAFANRKTVAFTNRKTVAFTNRKTIDKTVLDQTYSEMT